MSQSLCAWRWGHVRVDQYIFNTALCSVLTLYAWVLSVHVSAHLCCSLLPYWADQETESEQSKTPCSRSHWLKVQPVCNEGPSMHNSCMFIVALRVQGVLRKEERKGVLQSQTVPCYRGAWGCLRVWIKWERKISEDVKCANNTEQGDKAEAEHRNPASLVLNQTNSSCTSDPMEKGYSQEGSILDSA